MDIAINITVHKNLFPEDILKYLHIEEIMLQECHDARG
jgi:hypothetical protein